MNLTIFDLDHTLIPLDSEQEWQQFLANEGVIADVAAHQAQLQEIAQRYAQATLTDEEYLNFVYGAMRGLSLTKAQALRDKFTREHLKPQIPLSARALIAEHKAKGDLLLVITGSNAFMTAPIVKELGIAHGLGTEAEIHNGDFTGKVQGVPSMGAGKVLRLNEWLSARSQRLEDFEHSTFYSDSTYDLPLLERVKEPVAANPKPALAKIASERGWRVVNLW